MGFLSGIKSLFNKNIECGQEIDDRMVFLLKKKKYLHINKNIFVREKNVCVIVYKGKVCDVVLEGKYKISADVIPETYSKARVEWFEKNGHKIRKIRADIYYVNLNEFKGFDYISNSPFKSKTNSYGRVKGCLAGNCTIKIFDPAKYIKFLLGAKGKVNINKIVKKTGLAVGNMINHIVQKKKISLEMLLGNQSYCEQIINTEIQDALDKEGIFVSNIKLKAVDFNKRSKEKLNDYLNSRPRVSKPFDIGSTLNQSGSRDVIVRARGINNNLMQVNRGMQNKQITTSNVNLAKKCSVCHKNNNPAAKICINCGNKLN